MIALGLISMQTIMAQEVIKEKSDIKNMFDVPKNAIVLRTDYFLGLTAGYERIIPLKPNFGLCMRGSAGLISDAGSDFGLIADICGLIGKRFLFLEFGCGLIEVPRWKNPEFAPYVGCRYMGYKGLFGRVYIRPDTNIFKDVSMADQIFPIG